jgi:hypothetical protein
VIRVVLTVVVAVALVAAARPAIHDARTARATAALDRVTDDLTRAGSGLARTATPVPPHVAGARRRVELAVPPPSPTRAAVHRLRLRCRGPRGVVITARVGGVRRRVTARFPVQVALGPRLAGEGDTGTTVSARVSVVTLRLWRHDGRPTLVVAEGSSTVPGPPTPCWGSSNDSGRGRPTRTAAVQSRSIARPV